MFIGHVAVALAAKRAAPKTSLGTLLIGAQFLDLLWPVFLLLGIEHFRISIGDTAITPFDFYDYPISHSFVMSIVWSILLGGVYYFVKKDLKSAVVLGQCVFSHWVLDFLSHRPDLPLFPGSSSMFGLGLWNYFWVALIVEVLLFIAGIIIYAISTRAKNKTGKFAFWGLMVFLIVMHLMNIFGPPPPNELLVAISANAIWLLILWAYWVDKNRESVETIQNKAKT